MMKNKITQLILLIFIPCSLLAHSVETGNLSGIITDAAHNPIVGANILLKGTVRGVVSNDKGEYFLKNVEIGTFTVVVSSLGFQSLEKSVEILRGVNTTLDFTMQENNLELQTLHVIFNKGVGGTGHLAEVGEYAINATKKNEVIKLDRLDANLAMNNTRQIYSRVPGIHIWESDGSGIQPGLASRGLSPNRSWEFNVRMNGYDITPDPMGYPEAYYNPPMEVVDRIEIVRGASSLQYGPQFGGLLNYVLRKPDNSKKIVFESQNTIGNNGLFSTFNYIGGTDGKVSYTAYYQKRLGNGWRQNNHFDTDHAHAEVNYAVSNKLKIGLEMTYMTYISQQPGGLTDSLFVLDARQSTRSRNWFSTPWFIPALSAEYIFNDHSRLSFKSFGTLGERNSIGFVSAITNKDPLSTNRQIDRDVYKNWGSELRFITDYTLFKQKHTLATGARFFDGNTQRLQKGKGDTGADYNITLQESNYPTDLSFNNKNAAIFAENIFHITKRFLMTGGVRLEHINAQAQGRLSYKTDGIENRMAAIERTRTFILAGVGAEFHPTKQTELYSNFSQAYRPIVFSDLTPPATTDVIDSDLKDAKGYNFDIGYRGKVGTWLNFDVDYFYVNYKNRIGTITRLDALTNKTYQFRTNLGQSISKGVESYIEIDPIALFSDKSPLGNLGLFASMSFIDATYRDFKTTTVVNNNIVEGNLKDKKVENAPAYIHRFGATYAKKSVSITWQLSSVGEAYADASNTLKPTANGQSGLIPAYMVQDISTSIKIFKRYNLKMGINNLTDKRYFTRRAGGYPGPGLLPADGRTWYVSAGCKF
jgi:Fe(3+) dicitrate transport protein